MTVASYCSFPVTRASGRKKRGRSISTFICPGEKSTWSPSSQMMTGCDSAATLGHVTPPKIPIEHKAHSNVMSTGCSGSSFVCNVLTPSREIEARSRAPDRHQSKPNEHIEPPINLNIDQGPSVLTCYLLRHDTYMSSLCPTKQFLHDQGGAYRRERQTIFETTRHVSNCCYAAPCNRKMTCH